MKETLDDHIRRDPRLREVYVAAKGRYAAAGRLHHNFAHVMRDLYRALVIAEDEGDVDYGILIPAVLLHDIGFCSPDLKRLGHDVAGSRLAGEILDELGFGEETQEAVAHCILAHKGWAALPETREAMILYDADVLEKAGLVFMLFSGMIICEFRESVEHFVERGVVHRSTELQRGFYTAKAREMDGGRLETVRDLFARIKEEIAEERPDFLVREQDLWSEAPPGM